MTRYSPQDNEPIVETILEAIAQNTPEDTSLRKVTLNEGEQLILSLRRHDFTVAHPARVHTCSPGERKVLEAIWEWLHNSDPYIDLVELCEDWREERPAPEGWPPE